VPATERPQSPENDANAIAVAFMRFLASGLQRQIVTTRQRVNVKKIRQ
jgi:hypothetical protein